MPRSTVQEGVCMSTPSHKELGRAGTKHLIVHQASDLQQAAQLCLVQETSIRAWLLLDVLPTQHAAAS